MFRTAFVLVCLFSMLNVATAHAERTLRFTAATEASGKDELINVVREVYRRANINTTVVPMPAKRAIYELEAGISDGELLRVASFIHAKDYLIQLSVPVGYIDVQVFSLQESAPIVTNRICDYSIVIIKGAKRASELANDCSRVHKVSSSIQLMKFLRHSRAQIGIMSKVAGLKALQELGETQIIAMGAPLQSTPVFHFLHVKHKDLVADIEEILQEMSDSGELQALWQNYIDSYLLSR